MLEFFCNSLTNGFFLSSGMGKGIVLVQLALSVIMGTYVFGKWWELRELKMAVRRVRRDVLGERNVLDHHLARRDNGGTPLERVYSRTCERLLNLLTPGVRSLIIDRQPGAVGALTKHEMGLVRSMADQSMDEELLRVEDGLGYISTIVALAPMLGLLGTVWGVLDAFADMGAAGSATIATMAPAISSALLTTVVGLLVAIPGKAAHAGLMEMLQKIQVEMEGFLDDFTGRVALEFQDTGSRS